MFVFKKIIAAFLTPMALCWEISFCGLILLWFTRKKKAAKILLTIGLGLLYLLSFRPLSSAFLTPLENRYPYYQGRDAVSYILVLGGGAVDDPRLPTTSQLSDPSLNRLVESIVIYRRIQGAKLIFSGKKVARLMSAAAQSLGVKESDILVEASGRDTKDEARYIQRIVGKAPFILVTSASHIPRAMALFEKRGMYPIPAPVRYMVRGEYILSPGFFLPSPGELYKTERAWHEYLGLLWAKLRGQI